MRASRRSSCPTATDPARTRSCFPLRTHFHQASDRAASHGTVRGPHRPGSTPAAAAVSAGIEHRVEALASLVLDVDTPDDLNLLAATLDERPGQACMTRG